MVPWYTVVRASCRAGQASVARSVLVLAGACGGAVGGLPLPACLGAGPIGRPDFYSERRSAVSTRERGCSGTAHPRGGAHGQSRRRVGADRGVMGGGHAEEDSSSVKSHEAIQAFFQQEHMEANKAVKSHELITVRPETIGLGTFSRVRLVEVKAVKNHLQQSGLAVADSDVTAELHGYFALKVIRKTEVVRLKQIEHVKNESLVHSHIAHPFITTLFHRYQDERNLHMVLEYVQGGTMHRFIQMNNRLPNETARFFAAQTVMAVQYLHGEHIVYRDLQPENIMLDRGVYVKVRSRARAGRGRAMRRAAQPASGPARVRAWG